jgi:hypothetical protein
LDSPGALAVNGGILYVAAFGGGYVEEFSASDGTPIKSFTGAALGGVTTVGGIAVDGSGNFYVSDYNNGTIVKVASTTYTTSTYATGLSSPTGLAFDSHGVLYASQDNNKIQQISTSGTVTLFSSDPALNSPTGLSFDLSDNLYVANTSGPNVLEFAPNASLVQTIGGSSTLNSPFFLAVSNVPEPGQWGTVAALALAGFAFLFRLRNPKVP